MLYAYDKEDDKYYSRGDLLRFAFMELRKARSRYGMLIRDNLELKSPSLFKPALIKCAKVEQTMMYEKLKRIAKLLMEFEFYGLNTLVTMADSVDVTAIMNQLQRPA